MSSGESTQSGELYDAECERAGSMTRDAILAEIREIRDEIAAHVPSLSIIQDRMVTVEALSDVYMGHEWDRVYLLEALMSYHETLRDAIGAYA